MVCSMFFNLKAEMNRHGITTNDIAQAVGKDTCWVEKVLHDKVSLPTDTAIAIKKTFFPDVSYEYLFERGRVAPGRK